MPPLMGVRAGEIYNIGIVQLYCKIETSRRNAMKPLKEAMPENLLLRPVTGNKGLGLIAASPFRGRQCNCAVS